MERKAQLQRSLSPGEVEIVLRRAAELNARRANQESGVSRVPPETVMRLASAAGIKQNHVRRALLDLASEKSAEPKTFARNFYGPGRVRVIREIDRFAEPTREHLEAILAHDLELKLRRRTEASSLWDPGDQPGVVRRALDFSGDRALTRVQSMELRVEEVGKRSCEANITADVTGQRTEYLSLGGVAGATFGVPLAIAGVQNPLFFLLVIPAFILPALGFRLSYRRVRGEVRRALDEILDEAVAGPPPEGVSAEPGERPPGPIQGLKPIPRFAPENKQRE